MTKGGSGARILLPSLSLAIAAMAAVVGPAMAQEAGATADMPGSYSPERIAFDAADTNGDGFVSLPELARDAAVGFATLDKDGSMTLTPAELGPHDPAWFARIDTNHDGVLTFTEVMANKTRAFEEGDKNKDELLSFDEMVAVVRIEEGAP
jgi:Ca2+-binding EF-hand superfamily protein